MLAILKRPLEAVLLQQTTLVPLFQSQLKMTSLREKAETFLVMLSNLSPSDATFGDNVAIGAIAANDATGIVAISVADATANENSGTINFTVTSAFPAAVAGSPFSFDYESTVDSPFQSN